MAVRLTVEVADTPEARTRGLQHRPSLSAAHGMLFAFPSPQVLSFYGVNTMMALDIMYLDLDWVVQSIQRINPYDLTSIVSPEGCQYAVETTAGWCVANGVEVGDRAVWDTRRNLDFLPAEKTSSNSEWSPGYCFICGECDVAWDETPVKCRQCGAEWADEKTYDAKGLASGHDSWTSGGWHDIADKPKTAAVTERGSGHIEFSGGLPKAVMYTNYRFWLNIHADRKLVVVDEVWVAESERGEGLGTRLMDELIEWADDKGYTLGLTAAPQSRYKGRLDAWYKGFGFKKNEDFRISESRIRRPKTAYDGLPEDEHMGNLTVLGNMLYCYAPEDREAQCGIIESLYRRCLDRMPYNIAQVCKGAKVVVDMGGGDSDYYDAQVERQNTSEGGVITVLLPESVIVGDEKLDNDKFVGALAHEMWHYFVNVKKFWWEDALGKQVWEEALSHLNSDAWGDRREEIIKLYRDRHWMSGIGENKAEQFAQAYSEGFADALARLVLGDKAPWERTQGEYAEHWMTNVLFEKVGKNAESLVWWERLQDADVETPEYEEYEELEYAIQQWTGLDGYDVRGEYEQVLTDAYVKHGEPYSKSYPLFRNVEDDLGDRLTKEGVGALVTIGGVDGFSTSLNRAIEFGGYVTLQLKKARKCFDIHDLSEIPNEGEHLIGGTLRVTKVRKWDDNKGYLYDVEQVSTTPHAVTRTAQQQERCTRCDKPIRGKAHGLEYDQRTWSYVPEGTVVPPEKSQGIYWFGPECYKKANEPFEKRGKTASNSYWFWIENGICYGFSEEDKNNWHIKRAKEAYDLCDRLLPRKLSEHLSTVTISFEVNKRKEYDPETPPLRGGSQFGGISIILGSNPVTKEMLAGVIAHELWHSYAMQTGFWKSEPEIEAFLNHFNLLNEYAPHIEFLIKCRWGDDPDLQSLNEQMADACAKLMLGQNIMDDFFGDITHPFLEHWLFEKMSNTNHQAQVEGWLYHNTDALYLPDILRDGLRSSPEWYPRGDEVKANRIYTMTHENTLFGDRTVRFKRSAIPAGVTQSELHFEMSGQGEVLLSSATPFSIPASALEVVPQKTAQADEWLYHGTEPANLASIMERGLESQPTGFGWYRLFAFRRPNDFFGKTILRFNQASVPRGVEVSRSPMMMDSFLGKLPVEDEVIMGSKEPFYIPASALEVVTDKTADSKSYLHPKDWNDRIGRCYELAAQEVAWGNDEGAILIHGSIEGNGHPRISHAWIIRGNGMVYDAVADKEYTVEEHKAFYSAQEDRRYTFKQTLDQLIKTENYGPWHTPKQATFTTKSWVKCKDCGHMNHVVNSWWFVCQNKDCEAKIDMAGNVRARKPKTSQVPDSAWYCDSSGGATTFGAWYKNGKWEFVDKDEEHNSNGGNESVQKKVADGWSRVRLWRLGQGGRASIEGGSERQISEAVFDLLLWGLLTKTDKVVVDDLYTGGGDMACGDYIVEEFLERAAKVAAEYEFKEKTYQVTLFIVNDDTSAMVTDEFEVQAERVDMAIQRAFDAAQAEYEGKPVTFQYKSHHLKDGTV